MMRDVLHSFTQQIGLFPKQPDRQIAAVAQQPANDAGLVVVINSKRHTLASNDQRLSQPADSAHAVLFDQEAVVHVRSAAVLVSAVPFGPRESTRNCGAPLFTALFVVVCVMAFSTPRFGPAIWGGRKCRERHFLLASGTYFMFHTALLFRFLMLYYTTKGVAMGVVMKAYKVFVRGDEGNCAYIGGETPGKAKYAALKTTSGRRFFELDAHREPSLDEIAEPGPLTSAERLDGCDCSYCGIPVRLP